MKGEKMSEEQQKMKQEEQTKKEDEKVNVELQRVELPTIDYKEYIGKKSKIADVETLKGTYGYYLKLTSSIIDVKQFGKEEKEIRATRIFGLFEDENGNIGWGEETALGEYMKSKEVENPKALLGLEVTIQVKDKNGKEFLTFI